MQKDFDGLTKIDHSIKRLKDNEPKDGYYLAFSGGKDSMVLYDLALKAGVKFDAHYACGGIDPPELMQFIKINYPDVVWDRPEINFWRELQKHGLPRRQGRWCCEIIKEWGGVGRVVLTGVRWQESVRRKQRKILETCCHNNKWFVNPIIDWTVKEIWEYIKANKMPYCSLYDEGFKRLGCVLCPMETARQTQIELKRFPKTALAWKHGAYRYWEKNHSKESFKNWGTPEAFWQWWLSRKGERTPKEQCRMILGDN